VPGILGGEITCEPACPGVDAQARLHAGKVIAGRLKGLQGCAQLVSLRPVLVNVPRANGRATLSAFGFVAGPTAGTGITVMGIRCLRAVIAARVASSFASTAMITSSFSGG
jgi:hypothetical protein